VVSTHNARSFTGHERCVYSKNKSWRRVCLYQGLTGNQTLILIDGIRLNNSTFRYGPNQYLNTIDPYIIERIEVAKGTGSVQYGTDALGGVIHVLTKEPVFNDKKKSGRAKRFLSTPVATWKERHAAM
jgi:outer membrane receptor protein involved in Fe transport